MSRIDDIRSLCATYTEKDDLLGHIKFLLVEVDKLNDEIDDHDRLETLRRNREHASGWVLYWREKTGHGDGWYPDWDQVFLDWTEQKKKAESLSRYLKELKDCRKIVSASCDGCEHEKPRGLDHYPCFVCNRYFADRYESLQNDT